MSRRKYRIPRVAGKNPRAFFVAVMLLSACLILKNFMGAPRPEPAETVSGQVVLVHDGDTFTMNSKSGEIKVRLYGVDAPELKQAHGPESGNYLRGLINGREIQVESRGYDRYERLLGLITLPDGRSLANDLAAAGMVWVYDDYCDIEQCAWLRQAQKEAREAGRGLWAEKAVAPWDFRRKKK